MDDVINIGIPSKGRLRKDVLQIKKKKKLLLDSERGKRDLIGSIKNKKNIKILYLHARWGEYRVGEPGQHGARVECGDGGAAADAGGAQQLCDLSRILARGGWSLRERLKELNDKTPQKKVNIKTVQGGINMLPDVESESLAAAAAGSWRRRRKRGGT